MTGPVVVSIVAAVLALACTVDSLRAWSWRWRGWRVSAALAGFGAAGCASVAVRDLPGPVVVALVVAVLSGVAVATAWPLLPGRNRRRAVVGRGDRR